MWWRKTRPARSTSSPSRTSSRRSASPLFNLCSNSTHRWDHQPRSSWGASTSMTRKLSSTQICPPSRLKTVWRTATDCDQQLLFLYRPSQAWISDLHNRVNHLHCGLLTSFWISRTKSFNSRYSVFVLIIYDLNITSIQFIVSICSTQKPIYFSFFNLKISKLVK